MTYPHDPQQPWNPGGQGNSGQGNPDFGWQPGHAGGPPPAGWQPGGPGGPPPGNSNKNMWIAIAVVVALLAAGAVTWLVLANKDDSAGPNTPTTQSQTESSSTDNETSDEETSDDETTGEQTTDSPSESSQESTSSSDEVTTTEQVTTTSEQETTSSSEVTTSSTAPDTTSADPTPTTPSSTPVSTTAPTPTTQQSSTGGWPAGLVPKRGSCIKIKDFQRIPINNSVVNCANMNATYQVTDAGSSRAICDKNEAYWTGTGVLDGVVVCLMPRLHKGDCFRIKGSANGDYEKILCSEAKSDDFKVVLTNRDTADTKFCSGYQAFDFPKRKTVYCFARP